MTGLARTNRHHCLFVERDTHSVLPPVVAKTNIKFRLIIFWATKACVKVLIAF